MTSFMCLSYQEAEIQYIFVDVDEVLNTSLLREDGFKAIAKGFHLKLSKNQADWLLKLAEETNSQLVWCTTWQDDANEHIGSKIGLPEIPHVKLIPEKLGESLGAVKARAVWNYAGESKFVVFDDEYDIGYYLKGSNGLHIFVQSAFGLSEKDIRVAHNYLS